MSFDFKKFSATLQSGAQSFGKTVADSAKSINVQKQFVRSSGAGRS